MATISRSGISTAQPIQATHITNIIDALDGTSTTVTVVATGSFSGSLTGNIVGTASVATLATKASTLSQGGGNGVAMTFASTLPGGQPTYLWGTNDAVSVALYNPTAFTVNSASYAISSSLTTSASFATNATNATSVPFTGISALPASLTGFNNDGVSEVKNKITGDTNISSLVNGGFYPVQTSGTTTITLNSRAYTGFEVTFFYWIDGGGYDVQFAAGGQTIISANSNLKMNGTGSAVVAKYIDTNTWALIGNLKA
jgi:hypothetical protein